MKSRKEALLAGIATLVLLSATGLAPRKARHDRKIRSRNQPQDREGAGSLCPPQRSLPALPRLFIALAATISLHRLHAPDWRHPRSSWAGAAAEER
jgi:hypothetical protein